MENDFCIKLCKMAIALLVFFSIFNFVVGMNDDDEGSSSRDGQGRFTYGKADEPPFFIQEIDQ